MTGQATRGGILPVLVALALGLALGACENVRIFGEGGSSSRPDIGITLSLPLLTWSKTPREAADTAESEQSSDAAKDEDN